MRPDRAVASFFVTCRADVWEAVTARSHAFDALLAGGFHGGIFPNEVPVASRGVPRTRPHQIGGAKWLIKMTSAYCGDSNLEQRMFSHADSSRTKLLSHNNPAA